MGVTGERDQAPAAGEVAEVGASMAREAVEGAQPDSEADLAGEPGTMSEREALTEDDVDPREP